MHNIYVTYITYYNISLILLAYNINKGSDKEDSKEKVKNRLHRKTEKICGKFEHSWG